MTNEPTYPESLETTGKFSRTFAYDMILMDFGELNVLEIKHGERVKIKITKIKNKDEQPKNQMLLG